MDDGSFDRLISAESLERLSRQKILEAEILWTDARLRDFAGGRDGLAAEGLDPATEYRRLLAHRDDAFGKLGASPGIPGRKEQELLDSGQELPLNSPGGRTSLLDIELAPGRLIGGRFALGTSGVVQMSRASEGISVTPNHADATGEITTAALRVKGGIEFDGVLRAPHLGGGSAGGGGTFVWLRNWKYLVPFPAASTKTVFTYRFDVAVNLSVARDVQPVDFMSFVSVGEEPNLTLNRPVEVDTDAGWPLIADLTKPDTHYNGHYGWLFGRATVQRSFLVQAGSIPAVAVVLGAIAILPARAGCWFNFAGPASIVPQDAQGGEGRVSFHYMPQLELAPA